MSADLLPHRGRMRSTIVSSSPPGFTMVLARFSRTFLPLHELPDFRVGTSNVHVTVNQCQQIISSERVGLRRSMTDTVQS